LPALQPSAALAVGSATLLFLGVLGVFTHVLFLLSCTLRELRETLVEVAAASKGVGRAALDVTQACDSVHSLASDLRKDLLTTRTFIQEPIARVGELRKASELASAPARAALERGRTVLVTGAAAVASAIVAFILMVL
jgi:hypothetical protein